MRINLTKKDLVNQIYMQLGFSKLISENLINDFFATIILNLKKEKKLIIKKKKPMYFIVKIFIY